MRERSAPLLWAVFLAATVYGHVALKLATHGRGDKTRELLRALASPWAITGVAAWGLSSLLWMKLLAKDTLFSAASTASLKYVLLGLASLIFLRESPTTTQWVGFAFITVGVGLVR
ncbi:MAG: EamA family transporter [Myxococcales bacterium]|nr:EamA family transporter [Myxococcales bacterium]